MKTVNGCVIAANAFITTQQNIMSTQDVKRYVGMVQKKVNHKTNYYVGPYDEAIFMKTFDFIFTYDRGHKNIIIPREVYSNKVLKGYFRETLDKEFIDLLDASARRFLGIKEEKVLVKKK